MDDSPPDIQTDLSADVGPALAVNRANWDSRVPVHLGPGGYDVDRYVDDPARVSSVVAFDAPALGDLTGRRVVHLQCHIGTDTISLARLGAAKVVGVDFSLPAIEAARALVARTGDEVGFVHTDVYRAAAALGPSFDIVYTSVGTICWLDDIDRWAANVAGLLVRGGRLVFRDLHPTIWPYEEIDGTLAPVYPYWQRPDEPLVLNTTTSYLGCGQLLSPTTNEWNHTVAEVVNALIGAGLRIDRLDEHRECDWQLFPSAVVEGDHYLLPEALRDKLPVCWSITATRH
ncbi:MAG: class I SAM-dependent methyltransferase [Acidimicrobiales bacterium]